jgi:hypothetical protein
MVVRAAPSAGAATTKLDHLAHRTVEFGRWVGALDAEPAAQHVVVGRDGGGGHELGSQRGRLGRICHLDGEELAEQPLVAGHARDLAVAEGGDLAGERIPPAGEIAFIEVSEAGPGGRRRRPRPGRCCDWKSASDP